MLPILPLSQILAGLLAASLAFSGWQWVQIAGYKVAVSESSKALSSLETQLSVCEANNVGLIQSIADQNAAIEAAKVEAANKRKAALEARDAAVEALKAAQTDYARLRKAWPKDCVTAVNLARTELGL
jgi:hypothetical protein